MKMENLGLMTDEELNSYCNTMEAVESEDVGGLAAAAAGGVAGALAWSSEVY